MVFSSTVFLLLFLPLTLIGYYNPFWKGREFRNVFLLLVSLVFYGWGEPVFVFIMMAMILWNWILGLFLQKPRLGRVCLILAVCSDVGLLFVFKYLGFVSGGNISIALPIGISFFTFQMLSYILDVYRKKVPPSKNLLHTALYISMFPQLVAGPIVRYEAIEEQIRSRKESLEGILKGGERFLIGLGKKVLLANYLGLITDNIFYLQGRETLAVATVWLGAVAYTLQIYFDFSGYSDMAIGLGKMFGFQYEENFRYPYISKSITEFWKRWHISLSSWFRDYVYIPLGGSRKGKGRMYLSLFVVWLLTGIWHGANWTFLCWGLYYYFLLMLEKTLGLGTADMDEKKRIWGHFYTMLFVSLGWVLFRAESLPAAMSYFSNLLGLQGQPVLDAVFREYLWQGKWIFLAGILGSVPWWKALENKTWMQGSFMSGLARLVQVTGLVFAGGLSLFVLMKSTYNPFIYFNF